MDKLILKFESAVIRDLPIAGSVVTIGRKSDNDLVIEHPAVSGHHCKISRQSDSYFVEDLNSTNGTILNGKKIIKAGMHNQDTIIIAKHSVTLVAIPKSPTESQPSIVPNPATQTSTPPSQQESPDSTTPLNALGNMKIKYDKIGRVRITEGIVDETEYKLTQNSTYIGKANRVTIKIKGLMAPDVAAMICKKDTGYVLVPIKEGYPKVNGISINEERQLSDGDEIEVGGTKMQFYSTQV